MHTRQVGTISFTITLICITLCLSCSWFCSLDDRWTSPEDNIPHADIMSGRCAQSDQRVTLFSGNKLLKCNLYEQCDMVKCAPFAKMRLSS